MADAEFQIADRTLAQWESHARRDDCFDSMVPSDLRRFVGEIARLRTVLIASRPYVETCCDADGDDNASAVLRQIDIALSVPA